MKKNNIFLLIIVFLFFCYADVKALSYGGCVYSDITKLRSYVSNINITYDYRIINDVAYFDITLNNLVPGIYFIDSNTDKVYSYNDSNNGELVINNHEQLNGGFQFFSSLDGCYGTKISTKYYSLPTYNIYYNDPLCEKNRTSKLCEKWSQMNYTYEEFTTILKKEEVSNVVEEPKKEEMIEYKTTFFDKFVNFYTKYYYILLGGIIAICVTIMIIDKKKNSFDI